MMRFSTFIRLSTWMLAVFLLWRLALAFSGDLNFPGFKWSMTALAEASGGYAIPLKGDPIGVFDGLQIAGRYVLNILLWMFSIALIQLIGNSLSRISEVGFTAFREEERAKLATEERERAVFRRLERMRARKRQATDRSTDSSAIAFGVIGLMLGAFFF